MNARFTAYAAGTFASSPLTLQQEDGFVSIFNGDTAAHAFTFNLRNPSGKTASPVITLQPGGAICMPATLFVSISIDSATANAIWFGTAVPSLIVTAQATQPISPTGVFTVAGAGGTANPVNGSNQMEFQLVDPNGVPLPQGYAGGSACPATGKWRFVAYVTTEPLTINDGSGAKTLVPAGLAAGTVSVLQDYEVPVLKGTTYTLGGTGLFVLGGVGVIGP